MFGLPVPGNLGKATIDLGDKQVTVQFNPSSYSFGLNATLSNSGNNIQFNEVKRDDFTVELLFDTFEEQKDVRDAKGFKDLRESINAVESTPTGKVPKKVTFVWGPKGSENNGIIYEGYISSIKQNFTLFKSDGTPLRCKMTITIKNHIEKSQAEKDQGKSNSRIVTTIRQGERLDLLSNRTLHNPFLWREIVKENPEIIDNPRTYPLQTHLGKTLIIPDYYNTAEGKNG